MSRTGELAADGRSLLWNGYADERDKHYRREYGMKAAWVDAIIAEQGGRCPVCNRKLGQHAKPVLDEDHDTWEVFGVPCSRCNRFLLDQGTRQRLLAYLTDPPARRVGPFTVSASRLAARLERAAQRARRTASKKAGQTTTSTSNGRVAAAIERLEREA